MKKTKHDSFSRRSGISGYTGSIDPVEHWCERYAREHGQVIDLIGSNPTQARLDYRFMSEVMRQVASDPDLVFYDAQPLGGLELRAAIRDYYRREVGVELCPERIAVTASTSEAYTVLFDLIADPGDAVLIPEPGYPLLEIIGATSGLQLAPYRLMQGSDGFWCLDRDSVVQGWHPGVKAIVLISPHNPTGAVLEDGDLEFLEAWCLKHEVFLIVDEVFRDFCLPGRSQSEGLYTLRCPALVLHGMSKLALMPQLKLSWILMVGEESEVARMRDGLCYLLDGLLSVSAFAQKTTPRMLECAPAMQHQVRERCKENHDTLRAWAERLGLRIDPFSGSWYGLIREDKRWRGDDVSVLLAKHCGVKIHPGYFYAMPDRDAMVFSLLTPPELLEAGLLRIGEFLE